MLILFPCFSQVTNGTLVYQELKEEYSLSNPASRFYRLAPKGEKLVKFDMDETDVQAMIEVRKVSWIKQIFKPCLKYEVSDESALKDFLRT